MQLSDWNGLSADERDSFVSSLVEYGTDFVAPLYSVVEKIEETLQQKNSALRAQADARPLAWMTEDGRVATDETKRTGMASTSKPAFSIALYTHPAEAAAPGLSDDEIQSMWRDACNDGPGRPAWSRHIRFARAILTRASAATVAEPTVVRGVRVCSISDIECTKQCGAICHHEATQQQAEPGADERVALHVGDKDGKPLFVFGSAGATAIAQEALYRATQSGQRAGVAEIAKLREAVDYAAYEWAQYVDVDCAPRTLQKHMLDAFDAAAPTQQQEGGK